MVALASRHRAPVSNQPDAGVSFCPSHSGGCEMSFVGGSPDWHDGGMSEEIRKALDDLHQYLADLRRRTEEQSAR